MTSTELAAVGYATAALAYFVLTLLLLVRWRDRFKGAALILASLVSTFWAAALSFAAFSAVSWPALETTSDLARALIWILVLVLFLRSLETAGEKSSRAMQFAVMLPFMALIVALVFGISGATRTLSHVHMIGDLLLAVVVVVLAELIFRNSSRVVRSGIRYFCLAVAGIFLYDVVFAGWAMLEGMAHGGHGQHMWLARGYVNAMFVVLLGYSVHRRFEFTADAQLPRQVLFYSFALTGIGGFLFLLFAGDYFLRKVGGDWTEVLRIVVLVGTLTFAAALLISPYMRARTRVLLMKVLFQYKYDYRREWLRFIATLTGAGREQVPVTAARAVAQIVNSPGGVVWAQQEGDRDYVPAGAWNCPMPAYSVSRDSSLVAFLNERQWIIDLNEMETHPARYEGLQLGELAGDEQEWWLIVPMLLGNRLSGFIALLRPRVVPVLNFEDHDLLKTVGRHIATHIDQAEADRRLAEASQFSAYNRLTAFLMHDLNNLIAQLSLVVKNAERFRDNPAFVDDAMETIAHSVSRMRRLMEQLTSSSKPPVKRRVNVQRVLKNAVQRNTQREPKPKLEACDDGAVVYADAERLSMVIEHLVRNAQDATPWNGEVTVSAATANGLVAIRIVDTGTGMTPEFIRDRLFRPFDSTKGSQSMGIGAHQARDYADALGGRLEVSSTPGAGTEFRMTLPLAD